MKLPATLVAALAFTLSSHVQAAVAPNVDPCKLLTDAEVRAVFPGAEGGVRNRSVDQYGVVSCEWRHPGGRFAVQAQTGSETPENEARGDALGFLDPMKQGLQAALKVEKIAAGDGGAAIVEVQDPKRGVLTNAALAVIKRGPLLITLQSSQLASRPRADALKALETLGAAAAKRV